MYPDQEHEEDEQVKIAERAQGGGEQDGSADNDRDQRHGPGDVRPPPHARQLQNCNDHHEHEANRDGRGTPGVRNVERRSGHIDLFGGELVGWVKEEHEKG